MTKEEIIMLGVAIDSHVRMLYREADAYRKSDNTEAIKECLDEVRRFKALKEKLGMVKTIKIWNNRKNCTEYLYRLRPTRFVDDVTYCLKMDEAETKRASEWLTFIGIAHEVIEVEGNH